MAVILVTLIMAVITITQFVLIQRKNHSFLELLRGMFKFKCWQQLLFCYCYQYNVYIAMVYNYQVDN